MVDIIKSEYEALDPGATTVLINGVAVPAVQNLDWAADDEYIAGTLSYVPVVENGDGARPGTGNVWLLNDLRPGEPFVLQVFWNTRLNEIELLNVVAEVQTENVVLDGTDIVGVVKLVWRGVGNGSD